VSILRLFTCWYTYKPYNIRQFLGKYECSSCKSKPMRSIPKQVKCGKLVHLKTNRERNVKWCRIMRKQHMSSYDHSNWSLEYHLYHKIKFNVDGWSPRSFKVKLWCILTYAYNSDFRKVEGQKIVSILGLSNVDAYINDTALGGLCENMNALAVKIRQWDSFQRR